MWLDPMYSEHMTKDIDTTILIEIDDERVELTQLFSDTVEGILAFRIRSGDDTSCEGTIRGTDLSIEITAGYDWEDSWMGLTVKNGNGETVWERSDSLDWETCTEIPEAFEAWFAQV
jgi:hypothetical protein